MMELDKKIKAVSDGEINHLNKPDTNLGDWVSSSEISREFDGIINHLHTEKVTVNLRLDKEIVDFFKNSSKKYQSVINESLLMLVRQYKKQNSMQDRFLEVQNPTTGVWEPAITLDYDYAKGEIKIFALNDTDPRFINLRSVNPEYRRINNNDCFAGISKEKNNEIHSILFAKMFKLQFSGE